MSDAALDKVFAGSIPDVYERHMVPLIFEPYAQDLARRVALLAPRRVLEVAAGTGAVTRALARALPADCEIVATDLNPAMLDRAMASGTARPVQWRAADAMALPFDNTAFDAVVCQFGAMFFPDKARAFAEVRRVLRPRGHFFFNVWDRIETSEFADVVTQALVPLFPEDPPRFLARTPHGYWQREVIEADLAAAGFAPPWSFETLDARSRAANPDLPALAYCQGTPLRSEIEARGASRLMAATRAAGAALAARFGNGPVDGLIRAHVLVVPR